MAFMGLNYGAGVSNPYVQDANAQTLTLNSMKGDTLSTHPAILNLFAYDTLNSKYQWACSSGTTGGYSNALTLFANTSQQPVNVSMMSVTPPTTAVPTGWVNIPNLQASPYVVNFNSNMTQQNLGASNVGTTYMVANVTGAVFQLPAVNTAGLNPGDTFTFIVKENMASPLVVQSPNAGELFIQNCFQPTTFTPTSPTSPVTAWAPTTTVGAKTSLTLTTGSATPSFGDYIQVVFVGGGASAKWAVTGAVTFGGSFTVA